MSRQAAQLQLQHEAKQSRRKRKEDQWLRAVDRKDISNEPAGRKLIERLLPVMATAVREWHKDSQKAGRAGRLVRLGRQLSVVPPELMAFLTVREAVNNIISRTSVTMAATRLGAALEDELMLRHFKRQDKKAFKWVSDQIAKRKIETPYHQRQFYRQVMKHKAVDNPSVAWKAWSSAERGQIGYRLLSMFASATGAIKINKVLRNKKKTERIIEPHPGLFKWLEQTRNSDMLLPDRMPMLLPPEDWDSFRSGGYPDVDDPMVKHATQQAMEVHENYLEDADLRTTRTALHLLQNTPFRINDKVLCTMKKVWKKGISVGKLPANEDYPIPIRPPGAESKRDFGKANDVQKDWLKKARNAHDMNRSRTSQRLAVSRILRTAERLKDEENLYFPHQLDFRGRFYCIPTDLQPQGVEHARALLQFAEGKPVDTEEAIDWHMVHGANCYGMDKGSMADRIAWVKDNGKMIMRVARHPMHAANRDFWMEADKPFMFLAWCFDFWEVYNNRPSHIAVAMDGSCNGLQHFAAMLKDPVAAKAVNLEPGDEPQDIYQDVADRVIEKLKAATRKGGEHKQWAREFLRMGIDRKTCKRSVMVMPYGGTLHATKKYVEQEISPLVTDQFGDRQMYALHWLSCLVHSATHETVQSASKAMEWLQSVARIASEKGHHLRWTTPAGFVVHQRYVKFNVIRVNTYLSGSATLQFTLSPPTENLSPKHSVNGISPNFVHSLDACALALTVERSELSSLMMVHDDYGTHAADAQRLADVLREVFVEMYGETNLLQDLKDQLEDQLGEELPPVPKQGSFDVSRVLDSGYFFA